MKKRSNGMKDKIREYKLLNQWMKLKENEVCIADFLTSKRISNIGVYGYGVMGKHLIRELNLKQYKVAWVMDQKAQGDMYCEEIVRPDDKEPTKDIELLVIASIDYPEEIEFQLLQKGYDKMISIEELIDNVYKWGCR
jgi:6-phosphogluconate dehydrogenase